MNCRRAQREIALWVGHDLDEASARSLERHLACCPGCREHAQQMSRCVHALQNPEQEPREFHAYSLWPALSAKLSFADKQLAAQRFNGWLPAMVMAASVACLLTAVFLRNGSSPERAERQPTAVTPVRYSPDEEAFDWNLNRGSFVPDDQRVLPGGSWQGFPQGGDRGEIPTPRRRRLDDWRTDF